MSTALPPPGSLPEGACAPSFTLPVAGRPGETAGIPSPRRTGLTLLAFFKESCPTCRLVFPLLQRIHGRAAPAGAADGASVVGVSQDGEGAALAYAAALGLTFPILVDGPDYPVSRRYGLVSVPSLFLIEPDGTIRMSGAGFSREELETMSRAMEQSAGLSPRSLYEPGESYPEFKAG